MDNLTEIEGINLEKLYYVIGSITGLPDKEIDKIPIERLEKFYLFICELSKKTFPSHK